jgi:hypothetical protein
MSSLASNRASIFFRHDLGIGINTDGSVLSHAIVEMNATAWS